MVDFADLTGLGLGVGLGLALFVSFAACVNHLLEEWKLASLKSQMGPLLPPGLPPIPMLCDFIAPLGQILPMLVDFASNCGLVYRCYPRSQ